MQIGEKSPTYMCIEFFVVARNPNPAKAKSRAEVSNNIYLTDK